MSHRFMDSVNYIMFEFFLTKRRKKVRKSITYKMKTIVSSVNILRINHRLRRQIRVPYKSEIIKRCEPDDAGY